MKLEIHQEKSANGTVLISLSGKLNAMTVADLRNTMRGLIASESARIIVDLEHLEAIDSSGLSALISMLKTTREKGGFLRLLKPQPQVLHVFEITFLTRVFEMYTSVEAAAQGTGSEKLS